MKDALPHFARRMSRVQPNAVGALLRAGADPSITSFAGGYPDASLFPRDALQRHFSAAILNDGHTSLQYTVAEGNPRLRAEVVRMYARQGMNMDFENTLILQGSQQGLDLTAKLLIDPGDVIVTESPTFMGALVAFNCYEPRYVGIPIDANGMDTEVLALKLKQGLKPKFAYTIPDFQNPSGATMSTERRKHLVQLAALYDFIILEDTAYRPLRYRGKSPPTLLSLDKEDRVIHLGSFSKILAPGLRLGWMVAPSSMIEKFGILKLAADTQCSTLNMAVTAAYLQYNDLDHHVETLRQTYARKQDLMLKATRNNFPQEVSSTEPDGGLFLWLTFPDGFDTEVFMAEQALPHARVAFVPGRSFFPDSDQRNAARFNFSGPSDEKIEDGMARLGHLLKKHLVRT